MIIEQVAIGKIANFINGYAFKPSDWKKSGYKIIRIQNLTNKSKPYNYTDKSIPEKYIVRRGDVLVSWSATIDVFEWNDEDAYLNQHIFKVEFDEHQVTKSYFIFALKKTIEELSKLAHGATMKHVTKKKFDKHKIPLPKSIDDQIKIANLLSQVEALIGKREESINLLDELLRSTFLDMFGDPINNPQKRELVRFDEVVVLQRGFDLPKSQRIQEGKIPLYGSNGIVDFHNESKLNNGIVTGRSGTIGKVYYSKVPFWPLNTTLFSKDTKGNNIVYLSYLLNLFRLERFHQGAGVPTLNRNIVHKEKIYNVERTEQDKFATIVQQVEESKKKYQDSLNELHHLFGSLSQRAFKGELDLSGVEIPVTVKISDATFLDSPSSSGAGDVVIESQKIEHIKGRAKSGAGGLEEVLDIPTFTRKQIEDMTGVTQIAEAIKQENLKPVVQQIEALKKSIDLSETMKQISSTAKLFKSLNIPSFKPLHIQIPHIDMKPFKIFQTSQQLMESMQKRKEHVLQMLEDIPQIKQAIEEDVLCKDDFLDVTLRFDYEYAEIKRIIMDKLASNEIVQYFDEEKKRIKLGKAT